QEDIPLLANYFLEKFGKDWEMDIPRLSKAAQNALSSYSFPGNVRELENILERAITLCDDDEIQPPHLQLPEDGSVVSHGAAQSLPGYRPGESLEEYLTEIEKQAILTALDATRWNRTAAAKRLGMTFRSLRYRLKKLGLDDSEDEEEGEGG
ncbi:MAG TPA: helix-turn-helix domain-containing protein, partial [Pseudomonadales bacterium]|nr:helix-turn-helix domain-containing protein [Pseudomonadales bacterium]